MDAEREKVAEFIELRAPDDRLPAACHRASLCYERNETVSLYVPDDAEAAELDVTLWTFRQDSFIPHVRLEQAEEPLLEPVVIFSADPGPVESDVLIVISNGVLPEWFERFRHVYDFAPIYDEAPRQAGRERYAACQAAGYRMRFIKG